MCPEVDISQLNLPHWNQQLNVGKKEIKSKNGYAAQKHRQRSAQLNDAAKILLFRMWDPLRGEMRP